MHLRLDEVIISLPSAEYTMLPQFLSMEVFGLMRRLSPSGKNNSGDANPQSFVVYLPLRDSLMHLPSLRHLSDTEVFN